MISLIYVKIPVCDAIISELPRSTSDNGKLNFTQYDESKINYTRVLNGSDSKITIQNSDNNIQKFVDVFAKNIKEDCTLSIEGIEIVVNSGMTGDSRIASVLLKSQNNILTVISCTDADIALVQSSSIEGDADNKNTTTPGGLRAVDVSNMKPILVDNRNMQLNMIPTINLPGFPAISPNSYQTIRGVVLNVTSCNNTVSFYKPSVSATGVQNLVDLSQYNAVLTQTFSEKRETFQIIAPVDYYGNILYSSTNSLNVQILGYIRDSAPMFINQSVQSFNIKELSEKLDNNLKFANSSKSTEEQEYVTFDEINDGNSVFLGQTPFLNFSGEINLNSNDEVVSAVLYFKENGNWTAISSATIDEYNDHLKWNVYSMLGDGQKQLMIEVKTKQENILSQTRNQNTIKPDENVTVTQPHTAIVQNDFIDRIIDIDETKIVLSKTKIPNLALNDSSGVVLSSSQPLRALDTIIIPPFNYNCITHCTKTSTTVAEKNDLTENGILRRVSSITAVGDSLEIQTESLPAQSMFMQAQENKCEPINDGLTPEIKYDDVSNAGIIGDGDDYSNDQEFIKARQDAFDNNSDLKSEPMPDISCSSPSENWSPERGVIENTTVNTNSLDNSTNQNTNIKMFNLNTKPTATLNIPLGASFRINGAFCRSLSDRVNACVQGRGQFDFDFSIKAIFGIHLVIDVQIQWKYVAAAIAVGVAVLFATWGLGYIPAIAAAVGTCIALSCVVVNEFAISVIYGYQLYLSFAVTGKVTVKIEASLIDAKIGSQVVFAGPVPIYISEVITPKLSFEPYLSGTYGAQWTKSSIHEVGKRYSKNEGWSDIRLAPSNTDFASSKSNFIRFQAGFAIIPIIEASVRLYETLAGYFQVRFKFEIIYLNQCNDECETGQVKYIGFRFTLSGRVGLKLEVNIVKKSAVFLDFSRDFSIFSIASVIKCFAGNCDGSLPSMPSASSMITDPSSSQADKLIEAASLEKAIINNCKAPFNINYAILNNTTACSSNYTVKNWYEQNRYLMSKPQILGTISFWVKSHIESNVPLEDYLVEIINQLTFAEFEALIFGYKNGIIDLKVDDDTGVYFPSSLLTNFSSGIASIETCQNNVESCKIIGDLISKSLNRFSETQITQLANELNRFTKTSSYNIELLMTQNTPEEELSKQDIDKISEFKDRMGQIGDKVVGIAKSIGLDVDSIDGVNRFNYNAWRTNPFNLLKVLLNRDFINSFTDYNYKSLIYLNSTYSDVNDVYESNLDDVIKLNIEKMPFTDLEAYLRLFADPKINGGYNSIFNVSPESVLDQHTTDSIILTRLTHDFEKVANKNREISIDEMSENIAYVAQNDENFNVILGMLSGNGLMKLMNNIFYKAFDCNNAFGENTQNIKVSTTCSSIVYPFIDLYFISSPFRDSIFNTKNIKNYYTIEEIFTYFPADITEFVSNISNKYDYNYDAEKERCFAQDQWDICQENYYEYVGISNDLAKFISSQV